MLVMYGAFDNGAVLERNVRTVNGTGYASANDNPLGEHVADYRPSLNEEERTALQIAVDPAFDLDVTGEHDVTV